MVLNGNKSNATEGIPASPYFMPWRAVPKDVFSPKGNFHIWGQRAATLNHFPFLHKINVPVWKGHTAKLLLTKCWPLLYTIYCVFMKQRPNPSSVKTVRQGASSKAPLSCKYHSHYSREHHHLHNSHKQNSNDHKTAACSAQWISGVSIQWPLFQIRIFKRKKKLLH